MASKSKDHRETTIPLILISISVVIYAAWGFSVEGTEGVTGAIVGAGFMAIIGVILGIAAFYAAAGLFGMAYGNLLTAIPKVAAIVLFPGAIGMFLPSIVGFIVTLILYFGLMSWLFDLDARETIITVLTLWVVQIGAGCMLASMVFSTGW